MSANLPSIGRLLYLCFHAPLGRLHEHFRDGGPNERVHTEICRTAMESAATRLPALPAPPPDAPEVHFLTGRQFWFQTAFLLTSLAPHLSLRAVFHDDGSLDEPTRERLLSIAPGSRIKSDAEAREQIDAVLPAARFRRLRARREHSVLFRKILDVHTGNPGWNLFLDSDQLALRRPVLLAEWLRAPEVALYMTDIGDAYGCSAQALDRIAGTPVPRRVNTGILGLRGDTVDWDRMEHHCATLDGLMRPHYYHEQALIALHLAAQPARLATPPADYVVLPRPPEALAPRAAWHHYVADSKRWYYRSRWQAFAAQAYSP
jgi:hypothetical protein